MPVEAPHEVKGQPIPQAAVTINRGAEINDERLFVSRYQHIVFALEVAVRDTNPERSRALADEIAQQLILQTPNEIAEDQARQSFIRSQLETLQANIQATEEEIRAEQEKLDAANSARAIQQYQGNIAALQEKVSSYQATYASLLQTVEGRTNYISVFEPATTPVYAISPRVMETVLLAAAFPICECGVVAVGRGLLRKGLPLPHTVAYLLAAPIFNPVVIFSTVIAFGFDLRYAAARAAGGLLVPIGVALVLARQGKKEPFLPEFAAELTDHDHDDHGAHHHGTAEKLRHVLVHGRRDFLDMLPYLMFG